MKNRLEPLSYYVSGIVDKHNGNNELGLLFDIAQYNLFIKQNLSERYEVNGVNAHPLNRFVPCDLDGNVLVESEIYDSSYIKYQQAKDRVLFEGWKIVQLGSTIHVLKNKNTGKILEWCLIMDRINPVRVSTIEDLIPFKATLTKTGAELCGKTFEG